jgi:sec-independent protein translocase protein TatB
MDGIFGIGPLELILIAVIALIVLGPERLPSVMREGARYIREIRKLGNELTAQFSDELKVLDEINPRRLINEALDPNQPETNQAKKPAEAAKTVQQPLAPKAAPAKVEAAPAPHGGDNGPASSDKAEVVEEVHSILPPPIVSTAPLSAAEPAAPIEPDAHAAPSPEKPA